MKQEILLTEVINMMVISMNLICPSFQMYGEKIIYVNFNINNNKYINFSK